MREQQCRTAQYQHHGAHCKQQVDDAPYDTETAEIDLALTCLRWDVALACPAVQF